MDSGAIKAAAAATTATYRSFADATRSVLDLLVRLVPDATLYLAHLDRQHGVHRIVDVRGGRAARPAAPTRPPPLRRVLRPGMAEDRAPRLCNDVAAHPVYGARRDAAPLGAGSYLAVPLELSDGARVGSLAAVTRDAGRFRPDDEQLFTLLARVLAHELERESNAARRAPDGGLAARPRPRHGRARPRRRARSPAARTPAPPSAAPPARWPARRSPSCSSPSGREFVSTAMHGVDMAPVTIQPRAESSGRALHRARDATSSPTRATTRRSPPPLVEATGARSALFEPVLRDGQVVRRADHRLAAGRSPRCRRARPGCCGCSPRQAAVAIEHAGLRARMQSLSLTDPLTGVAQPPRVRGGAAARAGARPPRRAPAVASPSSTSTT